MDRRTRVKLKVFSKIQREPMSFTMALNEDSQGLPQNVMYKEDTLRHVLTLQLGKTCKNSHHAQQKSIQIPNNTILS